MSSSGISNSLPNDPRPCIFPVLNDGTDCDAELERANLALNLENEKSQIVNLEESMLRASVQLAWSLLLREYVDSDEVMFAFLSGETSSADNEASMLGHQYSQEVVHHLQLQGKLELRGALDILRRQTESFAAHPTKSLKDDGNTIKTSNALINTAVIFHEQCTFEARRLTTKVSEENAKPSHDFSKVSRSLCAVMLGS